MNKILARYVPLVDFLGKALGPDYEIALHDFSGGIYSNSIVAIANGFNTGRKVGSPITGKALEFISEKVYEREDYRVNYTGRVSDSVSTRSSTMFIKDDGDRLVGMLCVNYNTARLNDAVGKIFDLFQLTPSASGPAPQNPVSEQPRDPATEYFTSSIEHLIASMLDVSTPRERLTQEEKIEIVRNLNQKGVFQIKGAVSAVAQQLCTSEASVYRYLGKINREREGSRPE